MKARGKNKRGEKRRTNRDSLATIWSLSFQRFVALNDSVLGSAPCLAVSKDCFLYLFHRNARHTRFVREPRTSFGSLDRFSPSIRSAKRARKLFLLRFLAIFARTCTGSIREIGQSTWIRTDSEEEEKKNGRSFYLSLSFSRARARTRLTDWECRGYMTRRNTTKFVTFWYLTSLRVWYQLMHLLIQ